MRLFLSIFLIVITQISAATGDTARKYRWPLNIDNGFSSSFQEFRGNHFHAGMDLRTYQKTGYPVFAIADGRVYKIRMVRRGSGRGLYLRHIDGNSSNYFHLQRFAPKIERVLNQVQKARKKKYFGNYFLKNPIYVKRGSLIGYSGETGSGFPHLHVEIRDADNRALNPFRLVTFPGQDNNYPRLKQIIVRNTSAGLVNEGVGEAHIRFKKKGISLYVAEKPLIITGDCDIVLNCYDIADTGKRVAPHAVSAYLDGDHFFQLQFDRFSWEENNQLGFVYDMYHSRSGSYYFNLFNQKGYQLESQQQNLLHLLSNLEEGSHQLRVLVRDHFQNLATGIIPVYMVNHPVLKVNGITRSQDDLHVDIARMDGRSADEISLYLKDVNHRILYSGDLTQKVIPQQQNVVLKGVGREATFLEFAFRKKGICYFKKQFILKPLNILDMESVDHSIFINRDRVFVTLNAPQLGGDNIQLEVLQGGQHQLLMPRNNGQGLFFTFTPLNRTPQITLNFKLYYQDQWVKTISVQKNLVCLEEGVKQTFTMGNFSAHFAPRSVYDPKALLVTTQTYDSDYPVLSQQVSLSPFHFPYLDSVFYQFKLSTPVDKPKQLGIFRYHDRRKQWYYTYTLMDPSFTIFKTRVLSSGTFALMRDIFPPEVYFRRPRTSWLSRIKRLVIKITDKGKGINDLSLKIWLNGHRIDCEYDPDWRHVVIGRTPFLKAGRNLLKVSIKDNGDNITTRTFTFYLK